MTLCHILPERRGWVNRIFFFFFFFLSTQQCFTHQMPTLISLILSLEFCRDTLIPFLLICLHYLLRPSNYLIKENGFALGGKKKKKKKKKRSRRRLYPAETITHADYSDDLVLLENTLSQAEYIPNSLERSARSTNLR